MYAYIQLLINYAVQESIYDDQILEQILFQKHLLGLPSLLDW